MSWFFATSTAPAETHFIYSKAQFATDVADLAIKTVKREWQPAKEQAYSIEDKLLKKMTMAGKRYLIDKYDEGSQNHCHERRCPLHGGTRPYNGQINSDHNGSYLLLAKDVATVWSSYAWNWTSNHALISSLAGCAVSYLVYSYPLTAFAASSAYLMVSTLD